MGNEFILKDPLQKGVQRVIGGRALTESLSDDRIKVSAESGNSYIAYLKHNIQVANVYEQLAHFTNTGAHQIHIQGVLLNSDTDGVEMELFADTVFTSGGSVVTGKNFNRSSTNESRSSILDNNSNDLICSNGVEFFHASLDRGQPVFVNLYGSFILGINNTFSMQVKQSVSATAGVRAMIIFYEEKKEMGSHLEGS